MNIYGILANYRVGDECHLIESEGTGSFSELVFSAVELRHRGPGTCASYRTVSDHVDGGVAHASSDDAVLVIGPLGV